MECLDEFRMAGSLTLVFCSTQEISQIRKANLWGAKILIVSYLSAFAFKVSDSYLKSVVSSRFHCVNFFCCQI